MKKLLFRVAAVVIIITATIAEQAIQRRIRREDARQVQLERRFIQERDAQARAHH